MDSTLKISKGRFARVVLNGVRTQSGFVFTSVDLPLNANPASTYLARPYAHSPFGKAPIASGVLASMAIANMNPNRSDVDLPVAIAELRELPRLFKDALEILMYPGIRNNISAKANLAAQFGVAPIISDLVKLFDFAASVDKRERYLRELSVGWKRIKRNLTTEQWSGAVLNLVAFNSLADNQTSTNKCHVYGEMTRKYWFTARARLLDPPSARELRSIASDITLGIHTLSAKQVWELIPWSWLIDWFTNTGTLLAAYRGGLKWQWEGLNVMFKTTYTMTCEFPNVRSGFTVTPKRPQGKSIVRERIQPFLSIYPQFRMPYLTAANWSILLSLTILRFKYDPGSYLQL